MKHTPLGSSPDHVLAFIQTQLRHEWTARYVDRGAEKRSWVPVGNGAKGVRKNELVGVKSIGSIEVGWHWASFPLLPLITYVYVSWAFDENDRLIEVIVYKENDGV